MKPEQVLIGEVCVQLGLLRPDQAEDVLARLADGERVRFGDRAVQLGYLDEDGLARALAHQFRVNMVPAERLARLVVDPDVVALLPAGLLRERLLVPTFLDAETRVLSLLTADPTDIPSLRAAQAAAGAARLRLFVAARSGMRALVDRLVPVGAPTEAVGDGASGNDPASPGRGAAPSTRVVVLEPDPTRALALRRLVEAEGGHAEVVGDPEQVSSFIEANDADRVLVRTTGAGVARYVAGWRRLRPDLVVREVHAHGPEGRATVDWHAARHFVRASLELALEVADGPGGGAQGKLLTARAERMARAAGASGDTVEAVGYLALLLALGEVRACADDGTAGADTLDPARALEVWAPTAVAMQPPLGVADSLMALLRRLRGEDGPGPDVAVEMVFTARASVRVGLEVGADVVAELGDSAVRHDAAALRALAAVMDTTD